MVSYIILQMKPLIVIDTNVILSALQSSKGMSSEDKNILSLATMFKRSV